MTEIMFELRTFGFDTMLNHHLFQKLKLIRIGKFTHLINTLTVIYNFISFKFLTCRFLKGQDLAGTLPPALVKLSKLKAM